jgi:hypothetical protein
MPSYSPSRISYLHVSLLQTLTPQARSTSQVVSLRTILLMNMVVYGTVVGTLIFRTVHSIITVLVQVSNHTNTTSKNCSHAITSTCTASMFAAVILCPLYLYDVCCIAARVCDACNKQVQLVVHYYLLLIVPSLARMQHKLISITAHLQITYQGKTNNSQQYHWFCVCGTQILCVIWSLISLSYCPYM